MDKTIDLDFDLDLCSPHTQPSHGPSDRSTRRQRNPWVANHIRTKSPNLHYSPSSPDRIDRPARKTRATTCLHFIASTSWVGFGRQFKCDSHLLGWTPANLSRYVETLFWAISNILLVKVEINMIELVLKRMDCIFVPSIPLSQAVLFYCMCFKISKCCEPPKILPFRFPLIIKNLALRRKNLHNGLS